MTKYGMAIDLNRCVSCNRCSMACKSEHNLADGVWWNQCKSEGGDWFYTPGGEYPNNLTMKLYTYACQHCDKPACVEVCPTGASIKREDGIVVVDYDTCIGCQSCIAACPYEGVRTYLESPTWVLDYETGDATANRHVEGAVEKCTFCVERIDRGERPACMDICLAAARYFGDLDDPESDIAKVLAEREYEQLKAEEGTGPNVYFLK